MLTLISPTDLDLTVEDPVRPNIPMQWRNDHEIYAWIEQDRRLATVCTAWLDDVPESETGMQIMPRGQYLIAYTIWSTEPGAGRRLIQALHQHVQMNRPDCLGVLTLSPPTELARKFHMANGATVYRINQTTVNYHYALTQSREADSAAKPVKKDFLPE